MKNRFVVTEPNNDEIEFAFFDKLCRVYTQLSKEEYECLKAILQPTTEEVGEAILERGRVTLASAYPAVTSDVEVYELTYKDGRKRFIERDI